MLQVLTPINKSKSVKIKIARGVTHDLSKQTKKQAREQLDKLAEQERVGWNQVKLLAKDRFGKTSDFSLNEYKMLMEEVRKIAKEKRGW